MFGFRTSDLFFRCSAEMNENILRIFLLLSVFSRFCQQPVDWKHFVTVSLQYLGNFAFIHYFILCGFLVKQVFIISLIVVVVNDLLVPQF